MSESDDPVETQRPGAAAPEAAGRAPDEGPLADSRDAANPPRGRRVSGFVWAGLLLAAVASWFVVRLQQTAPRRAAVAEIERLGGTVWYEEQLTHGVWNESPPPGAWRLRLGDPRVVRVFLKKRVGDEELRQLKPHLANLPRLRELVMMACPVTDQGLAHLHDMQQLRVLLLVKTRVTRQGADEFRRALPRCTVAREYALD